MGIHFVEPISKDLKEYRVESSDGLALNYNGVSIKGDDKTVTDKIALKYGKVLISSVQKVCQSVFGNINCAY